MQAVAQPAAVQPDGQSPKRRWYRITPDRFLIALPPIEGLLLLSERFRWFPFNQHKGWTVLIAVAVVCVAIMLLLIWFAVSLFSRFGFQFSIRSLMLFVAVVAVVCSWFTVKMQGAARQREVVKAVEKGGGRVVYDYHLNAEGNLIAFPKTGIPEPSGPGWLRNLLGVDFFWDVKWVRCRQFTDAGLVKLKGLTSLSELWLHGTQVTDAGLVHLKGLTNLQDLRLTSTQVSDAGLVNLKGLTSLQNLNLTRTQVTDAGLVHLKGLTNLQNLRLSSTRVTGAGLVHLKGLASLQELRLVSTQVTDAGLEHIKGLTNLGVLVLYETQITDAGLVHLRRLTNLEELVLYKTQITDAGLEHLKGLANLKRLDIGGTQITDEGVENLQQALPNCMIDQEVFPEE